MSHEENKALVSRFVEEFWNQGNTAAADDLMTADTTIFLPGSGQVSKESFKAFATALRGAFPDWHSDMAFLVGEGDLVAEVFTARGTQQGELFGVPGSGQNVNLPGINVWRVSQGRIVERWGRVDELGLLRQLGLVPAA